MSQTTVPVPAHARGTAPGQYLGYGLQPVRLCFHLLNADPGGTASIEHLDDVALATSDNHLLIEQTKSALKQNPISDWSEDLWKTFANWLDNINLGLIDPTSTSFRLYIAPVRDGRWANRLEATNFPDDIARLLSDLEKALEKRNTQPKCYPYIKQLLDSDANVVTNLIANFHLTTDADPIEPIRRVLRLNVHAELLDHCCAYAIGLAKHQSDCLIRADKPAKIDVRRFQSEVRAFVAKNDLGRMLPSFTAHPTPTAVRATLDDRPMFVRQLNIVDMPLQIICRAISDYLQTASDKTNWAEKGLVVSTSIVEFSRTLVRRFELEKVEIDDLHASLEPAKQGRLLYRRCISRPANLEAREVPAHFVPGCYNALADNLELGWHPCFRSVLDAEVD